jgi:hypothetical protein
MFKLKQVTFNEMIMMSALNLSNTLYCVSSLKQSTVRNVAPIGHIVLIPNKLMLCA